MVVGRKAEKLAGVLEITGGNAHGFENTAVKEKATCKRLKIKSEQSRCCEGAVWKLLKRKSSWSSLEINGIECSGRIRLVRQELMKEGTTVLDVCQE